MNIYAGLINHGDVEGAPVLKEGHVHELIIDGEVIVHHRFRRFGGRCAYSADIDWFQLGTGIVEGLLFGGWMREGGKVEPTRGGG
jgi:hypothetical protein